MTKEERREMYQQKNQRRKEAKRRVYNGQDLRKEMGGAFGKTEPSVFNACAEGTTATRRAEH